MERQQGAEGRAVPLSPGRREGREVLLVERIGAEPCRLNRRHGRNEQRRDSRLQEARGRPNAATAMRGGAPTRRAQHPVPDVVAGGGGRGEGGRQAAGLRDATQTQRRSEVDCSNVANSKTACIRWLASAQQEQAETLALMMAAPRCCTVAMKSPSR
jgi:hypothetical protein